MRLINADDLIENYEWCKQQAGRYKEDEWNDVIQRVNVQPTVVAVPLKPLCEWLADYAAPPAIASNGEVMEEHEVRAVIWRHFLEHYDWKEQVM